MGTYSTLSAGISGIPPSATPSYYEDYPYLSECSGGALGSCPLYQQGQSTYPPSPSGLIILDFGAPCWVPTAQNVYGTQLFDEYSVCVPDSTIETLLHDWVLGYESDHGSGTPAVTVAAGTSNSENGVNPPNYELSNAQMEASGQAWYQDVVAPLSTAGLAAPLTIWGASDMEQSSSGNWYGGAATVDWVQGYASASPAQYSCSQTQTGFLADYGDDVLGGSGSADGWAVSQVYQVAWQIPVACSVPEIYYSGMAEEWEALSQWGAQNAPASGAILFTGVMTESQPGAYTPTQGWEQLQEVTGQSPPILTVIGTALPGQPPQVDSVAPNQGPSAGGTQVTISGANFSGAQAVYFGANEAVSYVVDSGTQITATSPAGTVGFADVVVETALGASSTSSPDGFVYSAASSYHPLTPARIEDTRPGSGLPGSGQAPGPGGIINVQVAGQGGVPSFGATAALVNLTITDPTNSGYVAAYPAGLVVPQVSTIDFQAGATKANLALVTLGRNGQISVYNSSGTTQVVVDVEGWYGSGAGDLFNPTPPERIVDTRPGSGHSYAGEPLGPGQSMTVQVAGAGGLPTSGVAAAALNVTVTDGTSASFLTVFPSSSAQPASSNLNWLPGQTVANQVTTALGSGGRVTIFNASGTVDVIVDVAGWFGSTGNALDTFVPARAVDTRPGSGEPYSGQTLGPNQSLTVQFSGLAGLPTDGITGLAINVTVTNSQDPGDLQLAPAGQPQPQTSAVNWAAGQTTENLALIGVGPNGGVTFYNGSSGSVDLVVDVYGWFG